MPVQRRRRRRWRARAATGWKASLTSSFGILALLLPFQGSSRALAQANDDQSQLERSQFPSRQVERALRCEFLSAISPFRVRDPSRPSSQAPCSTSSAEENRRNVAL